MFEDFSTQLEKMPQSYEEITANGLLFEKNFKM